MVPRLFSEYFKVGTAEVDLIKKFESTLEEVGLEPAEAFYRELANIVAQGGDVDYLGELYRYAVEAVKKVAKQYGLNIAEASYRSDRASSSGIVVVEKLDEKDLENWEKVNDFFTRLREFDNETLPLQKFIAVKIGTGIQDCEDIDAYIEKLVRKKIEELIKVKKWNKTSWDLSERGKFYPSGEYEIYCNELGWVVELKGKLDIRTASEKEKRGLRNFLSEEFGIAHLPSVIEAGLIVFVENPNPVNGKWETDEVVIYTPEEALTPEEDDEGPALG